MAEESRMARVLLDMWNDFTFSTEQFQKITEDFASAIDEGLNGRPSPLQMLPSYAGRPSGDETGTYISLDFGGTNLRVATVELCGAGKARIGKIHKVSLKNEQEGYDFTAPSVHINDLFDFIARQVAVVANHEEQLLGHSFSYASRQTSLGQANLVGWTKEIKVAGLAGQDINGILAEALNHQQLEHVHPVAVINDTTATLLAAAYEVAEADMGSVCGTGHNSCYYEPRPHHGDPTRVMAYNAESGGFDRVPFSVYDEQIDLNSEYPGRQRLEKMVAGRYLGEVTRQILEASRGTCGMSFVDECAVLRSIDGLSSMDVATFAGDKTEKLEKIGLWFAKQLPKGSVSLAERQFVKAVAEMVVSRSATLIAATYAGFLRRIDPCRQHRHVIGINGSLYEKMPGFSAAIRSAMEKHSGWSEKQLSFFFTEEAPIVGAAIAAAMAKEGLV